MSSLSHRVAEVLAVSMELAGVSQSELAKRMGVTPTAVSYWLTGKRSPSLDVLDQMSTVLGLTLWRVLKALTDTPQQRGK